ncbi:TPA: fimbrial protein [Raoultella planticola]
MTLLFKALLGATLSSITLAASAFTQGEGEPQGGMPHQYDIELKSLDMDKNHIGGRTSPFNWNLNGQYVVNFHCPVENISRGAIHYSTLSTMPLSSNGPNRYRLNEYLDVEVSVWIAGNYRGYVPAPFTNVSNRLTNNSCSKRNGVSTVRNVESGSKGKVVFIVTKPIINGINIASQSLLDVAGRMGTAGPTPTTSISRVVIKSGIITVPDKCTFNRGDKITVEFGNLPGSNEKLNGVNFSKSIPIHVQCEGGSFDQGALNINLAVQTSTASGTAGFNNQFLGTLSNGQKRDDLGIILKDEGGRTVIPNQFYNVKGFYQNQGDWNLTAAPIANPGAGSVKEGEFEASATVVAQFQ